MPVDYLSGTLWKALIYSLRSQNGGASQRDCARNSVVLRGTIFRGREQDIDTPHHTEVKSRICENVDSERAYNESHLYN
jgi:hypothetical protein